MAKLTSKASRIRTHVRVRRKVKGTAERPRLAVNFSGNHIRAQVIDDVAGKTLVSAFTSVRNDGGELKLVYLTKKVHDLLQMTRLYTVFDVLDDEAVAIKSFDKSAASSA